MKIKFNLGWIIAIAAAVALAAMGFLSFYYRTGGELVLPIIVAACLLVLPIVVVAFATSAKRCSKPFYFRKNAIIELILLVVTLLFCAGSMIAIDHFFTVNGRTTEIAQLLSDQNKQINEMRDSYKEHVDTRIKDYNTNLTSALNHKAYNSDRYNLYFPNGDMDINILTNTLKERIMPESIDSIYNQTITNVDFSWWELPSVMNNLEEKSENIGHLYDGLIQCDHNDSSDMKEAYHFWTFNRITASDIKPQFTTPKGTISNLWSILAAIIVFIFILFPYFTAERDQRSKGLLAELTKDDDSDDPFDGHIGIITIDQE